MFEYKIFFSREISVYFIHAFLVHSSVHIWPNDETVNNFDENII